MEKHISPGINMILMIPTAWPRGFLPLFMRIGRHLWISSSGGGLSRFDPQTETFTRYQHDPEDFNSLSFDFVWLIYQDQSGTLWVGTYGGGLVV